MNNQPETSQSEKQSGKRDADDLKLLMGILQQVQQQQEIKINFRLLATELKLDGGKNGRAAAQKRWQRFKERYPELQPQKPSKKAAKESDSKVKEKKVVKEEDDGGEDEGRGIFE
jgi:hypothetical protein